MKLHTDIILDSILVLLVVACVLLVLTFTVWMNHRTQQSCTELVLSHFREMPAGCL